MEMFAWGNLISLQWLYYIKFIIKWKVLKRGIGTLNSQWITQFINSSFSAKITQHEFLVKCISLIFHPVKISMFTVFIVGNVLRLLLVFIFKLLCHGSYSMFINRAPCLSMTHPIFGRKVPQEHSDHTPKGHTQQRL